MSKKHIWLAVIAIVLYGGAARVGAQESADSKPKAEEPGRSLTAFRLDFALSEFDDGKKINTRHYSMNLVPGYTPTNEIKIGTRVPVEAGHEQFQYMDVGTSIWCRIEERTDRVPLQVRAEISNFAIPDQATGHESRPAIRQFKINASTLALPGKPMVVGSVDDPNSKREFQLEVMVTKLK